MPSQMLLSSLLTSRSFDTEAFALAKGVQERRQYVDSQLAAGTPDHYLMSILLDQQEGRPYQEQRAKLDAWMGMHSKANKSRQKPGKGFNFMEGRAHLQAILADPDASSPKTTKKQRAESLKWLRKELGLKYQHVEPKNSESGGASKSADSVFVKPGDDWWFESILDSAKNSHKHNLDVCDWGDLTADQVSRIVDSVSASNSEHAWNAMVSSINTHTVPGLVDLIVLPDLEKDMHSRKNTRTGKDGDIRWNFRSIHKLLTLDQRWLIAEAFSGLCYDRTFLKQILIRFDAAAEGIDIEYDINARLNHIARLSACVQRMNQILRTKGGLSRSPSPDPAQTSSDENTQQYITDSLLAALAMYRLVACVQSGMQKEAESCLHSILRDFRWEFSPRLGRKKKRTTRDVTLSLNNTADVSKMSLWPILDGIQSNQNINLKHYFTTTLRQAFSDSTCESSQPFLGLIDDTWLNIRVLFATTKLQTTTASSSTPEQNIAWIEDIGGEAALRNLEAKSDLSFCAHNSTYFSLNSHVKLELDVQNVGNRLTVKMFELNTTSFYHARMTEIDSGIDLDGLVPTETFFIELSEEQRSPRTTSRHLLSFPSISKSRRGVFVVEVIAGGRSARALIRVGQLRIVTTSFPAGQVVSIFDEQNNPLPTDGLSIWLSGKQYLPGKKTASVESGGIKIDQDGNNSGKDILLEKGAEILIPYAPPGSAKKEKAIITLQDSQAGDNWSFSSLCTIERESERYCLDGSMFVDREALIMGNEKATLIIRPRLTINRKTHLTPISKWAQNVCLTIETVDNKGLRDRQEITDLHLSDKQETTHEFRVPAGLSATNFALTMDVIVATTGAKETLSMSYTPPQPLNSMDADESTFSVHLRAKAAAKVENVGVQVPEFSVVLVGKGGEPVPGVLVSVDLSHPRTKATYSSSGHSNEHGEVDIGSLNGFSIATVRCHGQELNCGGGRKFQLPCDSYQTQLSESMILLPAHTATLLGIPQLQLRLRQRSNNNTVACGSSQISSASLYRVLDANRRLPIRDASEKIHLLDGEDSSLVAISGLESGTYCLQTRTLESRSKSRTIFLNVPRADLKRVSGKKADMHLMLPISSSNDGGQESSIQRVTGSFHRPLGNCNPIRIKSVCIPTGSSELEITLEGQGCCDPDVRVHVLATHFVPAANHTIAKPLILPLDPFARSQKGIIWERPKCKFISNRILGDEYVYILDRKAKAENARAGVMLERSGLLLNPWDVRKTTTSTQEVRSGTSWENAELAQSSKAFGRAAAAPPPSYMAKRKAHRRAHNVMSNDTSSGSANIRYNSDRMMARSSSIDINSTANLLFLPEASLLLENLHVQQGDSHNSNSSSTVRVSINQLLGTSGSRCCVNVICMNKHGQSNSVAVYLPCQQDRQHASKYLDSRLYPTSPKGQALLQGRNFLIPPPLDPQKRYVERCTTLCIYPGTVSRSDPKKILPSNLTDKVSIDKGIFVFASSGSGDDYNVFNTLEKVYGLMRSLVVDESAASALDAFSFLWKNGGWAKLSHEQKLLKYSRFACHELNFFIYKKDPEFFSGVVAPYIANKAEPTFMDAILLNRDVSRWKRPAEMSQLNALEIALLVGVSGGISTGSDEAKRFVERLKQKSRNSTDKDIQKARFSAALKFGRMDTDAPEVGVSALRNLTRTTMQSRDSPQRKRKQIAADKTSRGGGGRGRRLMRRKEMMDTLVSSDSDDESDDYLSYSSAVNVNSNRFNAEYRAPGMTMEQAESNYWKTLRSSSTEFTSRVVSQNEFWSDYACYRSQPDRPVFLSKNVLHCCNSFTEVMAALSVLDIPLVGPELMTNMQNGQIVVQGKSMIVFSKSFCDNSSTESPDEGSTKSQDEIGRSPKILVNHEYWDVNDWCRTDRDGQQEVKFLARPQFEPNRCYGCEAVITNLTLSKKDLHVLLQIPQGAVPLSGCDFTKAQSMTLSPYSSATLQYKFYFPRIGSFPHFPVTVSAVNSATGDMECIASGKIDMCNVVHPSEMDIDRTSWDFISSRGSLGDVEAFLRHPDTALFGHGAIDLNRIAWRMKDPDSYKTLMNILEDLWIVPGYAEEPNSRRPAAWHLWSYSLLHGDFVNDRIGRFLQSTQFMRELYSRSMFVPGYNIGEGPQQLWDIADLSEHLEYSPLVNARAHQLGSQRKIMNAQLSERYCQFVSNLAFAPLEAQSFVTKLAIVYYWLALDRVTDAVELFRSLPNPSRSSLAGEVGEVKFQKIVSESPDCLLQWSYMKCYCLFLSGKDEELTEAATIASEFLEYPIKHWCSKFAEVVSQVKEARAEIDFTDTVGAHVAEGLEILNGDHIKREKDLSHASFRSPTIQASLEEKGNSRSIVIRHSNIEHSKICVNYYLMDIEFLFSTNPFVVGGGGESQKQHFSFVKPNYFRVINASESVELIGDAEQRSELLVPPPSEVLGDKDYIAEVVAKGVRTVVPVFRSQMTVTITENTGRLRATINGKSAPRCYVKVYSEYHDSKICFYKDGYTDIRGCFDYVSLDTNQLSQVKRFAILVSSSDAGALVKECRPPAVSSGSVY